VAAQTFVDERLIVASAGAFHLVAEPLQNVIVDYNGNTTSKTDSTGTTNYSWDYDNRLTSATLPGSGGTVSYAYDPFGRRIKKVSSSGTSVFAYDHENVIEETNAGGGVVARYAGTQSTDEQLAMLRSGTTSYYEQDGLGSVTSLSNTAGALAQTYTFDSFGKQTASSGSLTNPFQYAARELDSESSLYYMRARYFDSSTGRFLSEDPLEFRGERNFYRYALNNPMDYVDPTGLNTTVVIIYDKGPLGTNFGSHAALLIDNGMGGKPFLYDPAGSYSHDVCRSPHGDCSSSDEGGNDANVKKFLEFHQADPNYYGYKLFIFSTTPEQESAIMDQINSLPNIMGGFCSSAVSDALSGVGPFKNLPPSLTPGGLADDLQNIVSPIRPKGGHK